MVGLAGGGLLSATVLWVGSGLFEPLPEAWRRWAVVAVALLALLHQVGLVPIRLPQNTWQVPQDVLRRRLGALRFGFELGLGVRTYLSASAPYGLAAAVLLLGQRWQVAALAGLGFAAGRAATPLARYACGAGADWDARLRRRLPVITAGGCGAVAAAFGLLLLP